MTAINATTMERAAGKYLTFRLGGEVYGFEILKIQEIIGMMPIVAMPQAPPDVRGVVNLRGSVVPVTDLRAKFGLPVESDPEKNCVIVVRIGVPDGFVIKGVIVDEVSEVVSIAAEQLEPPPAFGGASCEELIIAMGKMDDLVVTLLDVERLLVG